MASNVETLIRGAVVKTIGKGETVSFRAIASALRVFGAGGISAE